MYESVHYILVRFILDHDVKEKIKHISPIHMVQLYCYNYIVSNNMVYLDHSILYHAFSISFDVK